MLNISFLPIILFFLLIVILFILFHNNLDPLQNTGTATAAANVRRRSLICKLSRAASAIY